MLASRARIRPVAIFLVATFLSCLILPVAASAGDRLPEFKECIELCQQENCGPNAPATPIPLHRRLLLWTCPSECDHTCQSIITTRRLSSTPPEPILQFHGKWPFHRLWGMQEPASVLFSLGNFYAHYRGLNAKIRPLIPATYGLRPYYVLLAYVGMASWVFSAIFHTRDFDVTEKLDYFAAGASVLYGLYYTPIRLFRLDKTGSPDPRVLEQTLLSQPKHTSSQTWILPLWTLLCISLYAAHVAYLTLWTWDYGYNMGANVAVGIVQNLLWSWFSLRRFQQKRRWWAATPGLVVAWVMMVMSLELLDFPPIWGVLDAHSLWHLGTIAPTVFWYDFLVKDAQDDIAGGSRIKQ